MWRGRSPPCPVSRSPPRCLRHAKPCWDSCFVTAQSSTCVRNVWTQNADPWILPPPARRFPSTYLGGGGGGGFITAHNNRMSPMAKAEPQEIADKNLPWKAKPQKPRNWFTLRGLVLPWAKTSAATTCSCHHVDERLKEWCWSLPTRWHPCIVKQRIQNAFSLKTYGGTQSATVLGARCQAQMCELPDLVNYPAHHICQPLSFHSKGTCPESNATAAITDHRWKMLVAWLWEKKGGRH